MSWFEDGLRKLQETEQKRKHDADKVRWLRDAARDILFDRNEELPAISALRIITSEAPNQLNLIKQDVHLGSFRVASDGIAFTPGEDTGLQHHTMETEEEFRQFLIRTAYSA